MRILVQGPKLSQNGIKINNIRGWHIFEIEGRSFIFDMYNDILVFKDMR